MGFTISVSSTSPTFMCSCCCVPYMSMLILAPWSSLYAYLTIIIYGPTHLVRGLCQVFLHGGGPHQSICCLLHFWILDVIYIVKDWLHFIWIDFSLVYILTFALLDYTASIYLCAIWDNDYNCITCYCTCHFIYVFLFFSAAYLISMSL